MSHFPTYADLEKYKNFEVLKKKFRSQKDFNKTRRVLDRLYEMKNQRENSCWWSHHGEDHSHNSTDDKQDRVTGSSWTTRWDTDYKLYTMWREDIQDGMANVKSHAVFAPIEATMTEFQDNNYSVFLTPGVNQPKEEATIANEYLKYIENKGNFSSVKQSTFRQMLITGTAITHNCYLSKTRKVKEIVTDPKEIEFTVGKWSQEEKDKWQKDKKPVTRDKILTDYDDLAIIPVDIYDFYVDPAARCLQGHAYEAADCVWKMTVGMDAFRNEFENSKDGYVIKENISKVKSIQRTIEDYDDRPFFIPPTRNTYTHNKVELVRYYNKLTDEYIVIANDILIRDGILPYNHKELPFSLHKMIPMAEQFYGIGYGVLLENVMSEDETLRNMIIDTGKQAATPPILVNKAKHQTLADDLQGAEPGQIIETEAPITDDSVTWMKPAQLPYDIYQIRKALKEDMVEMTGINSMMSAMPKPNQPVRNNLLNKEASLQHIKKHIANWGEGYLNSIKQILSIAKQLVPVSYQESRDEYEDANNTLKKWREIQVEGLKVVQDEEGNILDTEEIDTNGVVEITPRITDKFDKLEVSLNLDAFVSTSKSLLAQEAREALQDILPIVSNPQLKEDPIVSALLREYLKNRGTDQKVLDYLQDEDSEETAQFAEYQNEQMQQGEPVEGMPGMSPEHLMIHTQLLNQLIVEQNNISRQGLEQLQTVQQELANPSLTDEDMMTLSDEQAAAVQDVNEKLKELQLLIDVVREHLEIDNQPKEIAPEVALQKSSPQEYQPTTEPMNEMEPMQEL